MFQRFSILLSRSPPLFEEKLFECFLRFSRHRRCADNASFIRQVREPGPFHLNRDKYNDIPIFPKSPSHSTNVTFIWQSSAILIMIKITQQNNPHLTNTADAPSFSRGFHLIQHNQINQLNIPALRTKLPLWCAQMSIRRDCRSEVADPAMRDGIVSPVTLEDAASLASFNVRPDSGGSRGSTTIE